MGKPPVKKHNEYLRDMIVNGKAKPSKIVSHHIQIDQAPDAYEKFDQRIDGYTKVLIRFGEKAARWLRRNTPCFQSRTKRAHEIQNAVSRSSQEALRRAAAHCRACDLWKNARQTVFGEGDSHATAMFVGEQPGDKEDLAGHPFVGPAGKLFDEALEEAGIERRAVYLTNVVKHFSWEPQERGKRRIHKKPRAAEIAACRPWLDGELAMHETRSCGLPWSYRGPGTCWAGISASPASADR